MATGSPSIRELQLRIDASVEAARRNLDQLADQVRRDSDRMDRDLGRVDTASSRLGKSFETMKGAAVGLAAGFGVAGIVSFGRTMLETADDISAAAEKAGIGVERYQTLKEAFRSLEVEGEQFDKTMKVLQATLGEVQNGTDNGATKALDRLGISAKILSGEIRTSDGLLDAIAESLGKGGTAAQDAATLVDILGKKIGIDLAAALTDGGVKLHELEKAMIAAGLVIDEKFILQLADANEKLDQFSIATQQKSIVWAAQIISSFEQAGGAIMRFRDRFNYNFPGASAAAKSSALNGIVNDPTARAEMIDSIRGSLASARAAKSGNKLVAMGLESSEPYDRKIEQLTNRLAMWESADKRILAASARYRMGVEDIQADIVDRANAPASPSAGGGGRSRARSAAKPGPSLADRLKAELTELGRDLPSVDIQTAPAIDNVDALRSAIEQLRTGLEGVDVGSILTADEVAQIEHYTDEVSGFAEDVLGSLTGLNDLSFDDLLKQFSRLVIQMMVIEPIIERLRSGIGSIGFKTGGGFGSFLGSIGGAIFGGGRAGGGAVQPGNWYMTGENGPEPFVPSVPGMIIPNFNDMVRQAGGGATSSGSPISLTVNAPGATAETVAMIRRELAAAAPIIINAAQASTSASLRRPRLPS